MSETSHSFGVFLPSVSWVGAFQAESSLVTQEWEIGRTAQENQDFA
jgi:hypothetical protein